MEQASGEDYLKRGGHIMMFPGAAGGGIGMSPSRMDVLRRFSRS